ncbi:DUF4424 family protein [Legionella feeleii]|uniref:DUF4424 domain-containing protein n=1 Tax=Legionella feeleii TaxID=453 RepID=A0A0W0U845_9GAMM|nr:DUF4424 family protein [Legionella feeleii]KTD03673.1 hypothetical protein Lfee_0419 [Legionella feeleii]SPX59254.1 Uncharacterised protein [Legionella feeleii]
MKIRNIFLIPILLLSGMACANDSTAELASGGLVFTKNASIELQSEELFLSLKKVRIRYIFFNKSDKPIKALVAFPLPLIKSYRYDRLFAVLPVDDPANPVGFVTRVNNQPIKMSIHQKALVKNKDQTAILKKYKLPLSPEYSQTRKALLAIPKQQWPALESLGLIWLEEFDDGKGMRKEPQPSWDLKTTYTWEQIFPPRQAIIIEHEYQPVVGSSAGTSIGTSYAIHEKWYKEFVAIYCISEHLQKSLTPKTKDSTPPYTEGRLAYILKTGANWAGPIQSFTLTIDKGDKKNLLSFCGKKEAKQISATQLQIKKKNFIPSQNLNILFLIPYSEQIE